MTHPKYGLTGSKKGQQKETEKKEKTPAKRLKNAVDTVKNLGDTAKSTATAVNTVVNSLGNIAESIGVKPTGHTKQEIKQHDAYAGLSLTTFNPSESLAIDLYTNSSTLPRTSQRVADEIVNSVEEKRQTLRIVNANLELNTEALKTGVKSEKLEQAAIDYGTAKVNTDTKLVNFRSATVSYETALTKLDQTSEKLEHERVTLEGLQNETNQRRRFWQSKYELGESRIKQVELARYQLDAKIGAIDSEVVE